MPSAAPSFDRAALEQLSAEELALLEWRMQWKRTARNKQLAPDLRADLNNPNWMSWGLMTGRGFGKTLTGAHWIFDEAASHPKSYWHVIAPTRDDTRYTNFEGVTGIITVVPQRLIIDYNKADLIIYLWNGSIIRGFGAEKPERLRGPQCHGVWCDELAAWEYIDDTWDMMEFGLRLGDNPRILWTTTPQPIPKVKELVQQAEADPTHHVLVKGRTDENRENLTSRFYARISRYKGTRIGRQELDGELIDLEEAGIVKRKDFQLWPHDRPLPSFEHIVYSLDSAFTAKTFDPKKRQPDPSACITFGLFVYRRVYHVMVLDCWQDWLGFPELVEKVRSDMRVTYGAIDRPVLQHSVVPSRYTQNPVSVGRGIDLLLIEDKGSGISLRQTLAMENIFMEPYNPGRADKLARLHAVTPMTAHGRVWLVESDKFPGKPKTWYESDELELPGGETKKVPGFLGEVCAFHGEGTVQHDDYVDAYSQGLRYFMNRFIQTFIGTETEEERLRHAQEEDRFRERGEKYENPYAQ